MGDANDPAREVLVVVDPSFGKRLRDAWHGQPVWITMSPVNAPEVRALWASAPSPNRLAAITGFLYEEKATAEDRLLGQLSAIDLHYGPYSTTTPYAVFTVIGAHLTEQVRAALSALGFTIFQPQPNGFTAARGEDDQRVK
jgi:hypothetical protein